ncbi:ABC-F family ATP-binding cassette domain-containing protein [Streptacidiphilus cavernicola]|uniref:ABC-F family ATP-binding cassette domain-containing protein n=1 Tax=Streptacidiphilus cavernicola TaxID=3342716 RepID=A0ABV6VSI7_9ACTN
MSVRARDVTFSYGSHVVLTGLDLLVDGSDRLAVVGPNGSGKSTLLRLLAGEEQPEQGAVTSTGTVGLLPQERDVRPDETVLAYLQRRTGTGAAEARMLAAADLLAEQPGAASEDGYAEALERYLALGGADLTVRAAAVLAELGLPEDVERQSGSLSGGERARLALAGILLARFDTLLLDEPTNDLDLDGLERLEAHIAGRRGGLAVVSHDRAFLEHIASDVLDVDVHTGRATRYGGGYRAYTEERARDRRHAHEEYQAYADERDRLVARARTAQEWAASGARTARKATDGDKMLRHGRIQSAQRTGAKAAAALRDVQRLEQVEEPRKEWELHLRFGTRQRSGDRVAALERAVVRRGGFRLGPVDVSLGWGDRVALTGPNGAGKSTFVQALLGRVPLASGSRGLGASVVVGEIGQTRATFDPAATVVDAFRGRSGQAPADARTLLAKFGLGSDHVLRPVGSLSPGERTRLDLALLMEAQANFLVLDEPTNHLDLPAIEQLEYALGHFDGTLLVVSHDRRFIDRLGLTRRLVAADGTVREQD